MKHLKKVLLVLVAAVLIIPAAALFAGCDKIKKALNDDDTIADGKYNLVIEQWLAGETGDDEEHDTVLKSAITVTGGKHIDFVFEWYEVTGVDTRIMHLGIEFSFNFSVDNNGFFKTEGVVYFYNSGVDWSQPPYDNDSFVFLDKDYFLEKFPQSMWYKDGTIYVSPISVEANGLDYGTTKTLKYKK